MEKVKTAAVLTIKQASLMSEEGKAAVADWLRNEAKLLIKKGDQYSKRFRARYQYIPRKRKKK